MNYQKSVLKSLLLFAFVVTGAKLKAQTQGGTIFYSDMRKEFVLKSGSEKIWEVLLHTEGVEKYTNGYVTSAIAKETAMGTIRTSVLKDGTKREEKIMLDKPRGFFVQVLSPVPAGLKMVMIDISILDEPDTAPATRVKLSAYITGDNKEAKEKLKTQFAAEFENYAKGLEAFFGSGK
jgi:hypothetical protein